MKDFITRHGKALDFSGAFLVVIGILGSLTTGYYILAAAFLCGAAAFGFSYAIHDMGAYDNQRDFFLLCCTVLAVAAALLFIAALIVVLV